MRNHSFWIRLAGFPVWLSSRYAGMDYFFRGYRILPSEEDKAEYDRWIREAGYPAGLPLSVSEEELLAEAEAGEETPGAWPDNYLESLAFYRKICSGLLFQDTLLFHCSALKVDGAACLFTAPSGTGKSTHARLWRGLLGERAVINNDDKPLLRRMADGSFYAYGTPYAGKHHLQTNTSARVGAVFCLHQAEENTIRRMTAREAFPFLFVQGYRDRQNPASVARAMDLIYGLAGLPVFSLGCTISEEAARLAYGAFESCLPPANGRTENPQPDRDNGSPDRGNGLPDRVDGSPDKR